MSLDKKSAVQILNSRSLIHSAGKFTVKATSVSPFQREDGTLVQIVNFNAMTAYQLGQSKEAFAEGDYDSACNFNMSASQLQGRYVPAKGETVDIEVVDFINKDGVSILVVDSIIPRKATAATRINFSLDEEEEEVTATKGDKAAAEPVLV